MKEKQKTPNEEAYTLEQYFLTTIKTTKDNLSVKTELESMIEVYNDILKGLMKLKINIEILDGLCITSPDNPELFKERDKVKEDININIKAVGVIRQQIIDRKNLEK